MSSADAIARVIQDFRAGKVGAHPALTLEEAAKPKGAHIVSTLSATIEMVATATVVDVTAIHREQRATGASWRLYEDTVMRPPWIDAAVCYESSTGNVILMHVMYVASTDEQWEQWRQLQWESLADTHTIDWDTVAWIAFVNVWVGGRDSTGTQHHTSGPLHLWRVAVGADGRPLDIRWDQLRRDLPLDTWDMPAVVLWRALTLLNCRNIEVLEPLRPRAQQRRLTRSGVTVTEIHVTPIGKWRRGGQPTRLGQGVPLSTVRGHVARYGEQWGRGKLFGRLEGEYWIPAHVRGTKELGEHQAVYVVG